MEPHREQLWDNMSVNKIPVVGIVACLVPEMGIGFQGTLPWRLSQEMRYFKQITSSTWDPNKVNAVVMGRKTWDSIPNKFRPLPNRINLVVSRQYQEPFSSHNDVYQSNSLVKGLDQLKEQLGDKLERIFIIGGGEIYNQSYDLIDHWLVTKIRPLPGTQIPEMDTFLNKERLTEQFQESSTESLLQFMPPEVILPQVRRIDDSLTSSLLMQEKGYEFWITLHDKISS